ncbi:hypothetical protein RSOLAG1IB_01390 [Rhizoctonia solani AG-1 IB]|uniref:Uncharacterized protein n=1 Tax=Thanatephorus cucumeris (strain AG1-IB / isolate 7/3/14) TaxID=1108050 RepID=A0A0B7FCR2_THACB|nr:hypothetical protein RSOLAG1IB_01390 [Rhizoctonia solani AG-1 IB]
MCLSGDIDQNEALIVATFPVLAPSVAVGVVKGVVEHVHSLSHPAFSQKLQRDPSKLDIEIFELSANRTPKGPTTAEQLCSTTNTNMSSSYTSPHTGLPESQPQSSCSNWANTSEPRGHSPETNIASHAVETCEPNLRYPQPVHTASPLLTHDSEGDTWAINQYITSDPRFRDSTLVFPRVHQPSNPSWPFWKRYRVAILTMLATLIAFGFVLAAIIGSINIKNE